MRLLRLNEVESRSTDRVYAHSRLLALFITFAAIGTLCALLFYTVSVGWKLGYYFVTVLVLLFAIMRRFITASFYTSNWLVRMNQEGIFIQFRSYLNYHLAAEDKTVVFIPYQEICSARLVRERAKSLSMQGGTATQTTRYVELELAADPAPLSTALQAELTRKAPSEKRWYGSSSTLYEDHPVSMSLPPFLRVRWTGLPGVRSFLNALSPYTVIAEPVLIERNFAELRALPHEEQENRLRELVQRGDRVAAIYTAREIYRCGLQEAVERIDTLQKTT